MSWLNRAIAVVSPRLALTRMRHQLAANVFADQLRKRSYNGAGRGRRQAGWKAPGTSANAETIKGVVQLRNLARDLERNNAYAAKALTVFVSNVVGTGIRCQPRSTNKDKAKRVTKVWESWAETKACDFDGRHNLYGLQALALQATARDGEVIVRFRRGDFGGPVPLKLQVLEADFLDESKASFARAGENRIIQGVEVDDSGRVVAYWLHQYHPGEPGWALSQSERVPADQVARMYRQDRAGQLRGVTWFAPVMLPLRDLDDYEDAQLVRQKVAACFAIFIHDATGEGDVGVGNGPPLPDRVEPGIIETLPAGKDIKFASPPGVDGYADYVRSVLRKVAAGLGITYESLTGDLTATSFSGGRMGWIEFHRNVEAWRWRMMIPQFCEPVWAQFATAASMTGLDINGMSADWTPPRREMVNPKEEIAAARDAIRSGQTSWSETVREWGFDPETLAQELADDAKRFDRHGLVLDCDPRKTTQQGQPRDKAPGQAGSGEEETTP